MLALTEMTEEEFHGKLISAFFEDDYEEFLHPDLIERTNHTLHVLLLQAQDSLAYAKEIGDDNKVLRNSRFLRRMQRAITEVKPALKAARLASVPSGTTNWRKVAMEMLPLIERAIDEGRSDHLDDDMIDFLDRWDQKEFQYRSHRNLRKSE